MIPISVCIITKNEAHHLKKCLKALSAYPFEIVVVDTGSADDSKKIALQYTDKVYDFEWIDDFSAAKNYAISKASHNMILSLDTDEFVTDVNIEALSTLMQMNPEAVGAIELYNYFENNNMMRSHIQRLDRLFNRKYYEFQNPIHECLFPKKNITYSSYEVPITVDHVGYLGTKEQLDAKSLRDIKLLQKELNKEPDNPYLYFQIGQSYLMMRDEVNSLTYFRKAEALHPPVENEYTRILVKNLGEVLLTHDLIDEALALRKYYTVYENNADYLCLIGTIYMQNNEPLKALPEFIKALTAPEYDSPDSRREIPSFYIGHIYQCFGQIDIAISHFEKCGDYPPALERLEMLRRS